MVQNFFNNINRYKYLILGIGYIIAFFISYKNQQIINNILSDPVGLFSVVVVFGAISIYLWKIFFPLGIITKGKMLRDINIRVSKTSVPFIIRIINDEISGIAREGLKERIKESNVWDWTVIGRHVDLNYKDFAIRLKENIFFQYFGNDNEDIGTSSLIVIDSYPWGRKNMIFTGTLMTSRNNYEKSVFPPLPVCIDPDIDTCLQFSSYYEYSSVMERQGSFVIKRCRYTYDHVKTTKKWIQLENDLIDLIDRMGGSEKVNILCWSQNPPSEDEINAIKNSIASVAPTNFSEIYLKPNKTLFSIFREIGGNLNVFDIFLLFVGYLLSPISFYNDAIVNIPISSYLALKVHPVLDLPFSLVTAIFYIFTNLLGLFFMWIPLKRINKSFKWNFLNKKSLLIILLISFSIFAIFEFVSFLFIS
jgi:hypothetical protein